MQWQITNSVSEYRDIQCMWACPTVELKAVALLHLVLSRRSLFYFVPLISAKFTTCPCVFPAWLSSIKGCIKYCWRKSSRCPSDSSKAKWTKFKQYWAPYLPGQWQEQEWPPQWSTKRLAAPSVGPTVCSSSFYPSHPLSRQNPFVICYNMHTAQISTTASTTSTKSVYDIRPEI